MVKHYPTAADDGRVCRVQAAAEALPVALVIDDLNALFAAATARLLRCVDQLPEFRAEVQDCMQALQQVHGMAMWALAGHD